MTDPAGASAVPELDGTNWRQWFLRMENYLRIHNLWDVTSNEQDIKMEENGVVNMEDKCIYGKVQKARCRIINCVNSEYSGHITRCDTAHQVWTVLKNLYQQTGQQRETELRQKLNKAKKHHDQSIDQYINTIVQIVDELRQVNVDLSEEEMASAVLEGLPANYHTVTVVLKHYHCKLTMAKVRESLTYEESYLKKGNAYVTQDKKKVDGEKITCQYCHKTGHTLQNCFKFKGDYPPRTRKYGDKTPNGTNAKSMALMAGGPEIETKNDDNWIIDSGASWHMTGNKEYLEVSTIEEYETSIVIADGSQLKSECRGKVRLTLKDEHSPPVELDNVLYIPGLTTNLLSVNCMVSKGATVNFKRGLCTIWHNHLKLQAKANESANYCLQATAKTWHQRLGHVHAERLRKLRVPYKLTDPCETCIANKQSATKFQPKNYHYKPLDLLYMDVVGPIHPPTPSDQHYYLSVLDHATKTTLIYLMEGKGQAGKYARAAITTLERKSNGTSKVNAIRTDQGQEFLGRKLADFLSDRGIVHERTAGYAPQQNDAERLHRDIREHASSMLNATNLPKKYWGEAVRAYVHVRNRLPPTHTEETKSPLELLSGVKPSIKHLRVFGCEAWVLKPVPKQTGKFEPRSEKGIFIGYENSTTYRILLEDRMVTSRNVRFIESNMGVYTRPSDEPTELTFQEELKSEPDQWEESSDTDDAVKVTQQKKRKKNMSGGITSDQTDKETSQP